MKTPQNELTLRFDKPIEMITLKELIPIQKNGKPDGWEEELDMAQFTDAEAAWLRELYKRHTATEPSAWAKRELEDAVTAGITTGETASRRRERTMTEGFSTEFSAEGYWTCHMQEKGGYNAVLQA